MRKMKGIIITLLLLSITTISAFSAQNAPSVLNTYDLTYLYDLDNNGKDPVTRKTFERIWDTLHFVCAIQGIVNQKEPNLYVFFVGNTNENDKEGHVDKYWLEKMTSKGDWMENTKINPIPTLDALINKYKKDIKGLVVYDGNVPATANVASTIAGVEKLAPVRYDDKKDSLYYYLTKDSKGPKLPVKKWLVNKNGSSLFTGKGTIYGTKEKSTGSAKCDAYIYAKINYLDNGKCNPHYLGYYIDSVWIDKPWGRLSNSTLTNHDYIIANKGFVFDLSMWEDEPATDEPNQPIGADYNTLTAILLSAYNQSNGKMNQVSGFHSWDRKYTIRAGGIHDDVPGEWRYAEILSNFNAYMDADALALSGMSNGSVFCKFTMKEKYPQKKPTIDDLKAMGLILPDGSVKKASYFSIYVGDYDSSAWLYQRTPINWADPERGTVPLGWAFNPNLSERFAYGMDYIRRTATENDYFVTGDSGAGYINPSYLVPPRIYSNLPSGLKSWEDHCKYWMDKLDISVVGFVIDGYAPSMSEDVLDMYSRIAPDGIGGHKLITHDGVYKGIMPYVRLERDIMDVEKDAKDIAKNVMGEAVPDFYMYRNILWTPTGQKTFIDNVINEMDGNAVYLEPYHFFLLMKYFYETGQEAVVSERNKNLFDYRKGIDFLNYSPIGQGFDIRDIFGGTLGNGVEKNMIIFECTESDREFFVEWKTKEPEKLASIFLKIRGDSPSRIRYISGFTLKVKNSIDESWKTVVDKSLSYPMTEDNVFNLDEVVNAQYFRAEFKQDMEADMPSMGPRIITLQGFDEKQ